MENIRGMDFTSGNLGRKNPFLNGVKFLFPEKAKGPVRWKQSQDACDSSEVHFFFFSLRQRKKSDKLILIGRSVRFHFLTEKFILFPPHTQHHSFSLLLLLYITLRNKAISKNTCLIIWLWSITLSLRIGFLTCQMWLSLPNSLSTYKVQLLGENWSKIETFAGVWARGCVSLKYDHPGERWVGSIGLGMSKYSHKNISFLKKKD